jgi:hypothetical protein
MAGAGIPAAPLWLWRPRLWSWRRPLRRWLSRQGRDLATVTDGIESVTPGGDAGAPAIEPTRSSDPAVVAAPAATTECIPTGEVRPTEMPEWIALDRLPLGVHEKKDRADIEAFDPRYHVRKVEAARPHPRSRIRADADPVGRRRSLAYGQQGRGDRPLVVKPAV